MLKQNKNK